MCLLMSEGIPLFSGWGSTIISPWSEEHSSHPCSAGSCLPPLSSPSPPPTASDLETPASDCIPAESKHSHKNSASAPAWSSKRRLIGWWRRVSAYGQKEPLSFCGVLSSSFESFPNVLLQRWTCSQKSKQDLHARWWISTEYSEWSFKSPKKFWGRKFCPYT